MLADFGKHLLDDNKLIGDEGEGCAKLFRAGKALNIKNGIIKDKQAL